MRSRTVNHLTLTQDRFFSSGALLIDVDNIDELSEDMDASAFGSWLMALTRTFLSECDEKLDKLTVRLYGGWYEADSMTSRASKYAALAQMGDPFPLIEEGMHVSGSIKLADGPVSTQGLILPHTFRRRGSAARILRNRDLNNPSCCGDENCSAKLLGKWSKGPNRVCPTEGCNVTYSDAFFGSEQKMVDALLAMDLIEIVTLDTTRAIAVVSDDTDFVPALLYAADLRDRRTGDRQIIAIRKQQLDPLLVQILTNAGIKDLRMD